MIDYHLSVLYADGRALSYRADEAHPEALEILLERHAQAVRYFRAGVVAVSLAQGTTADEVVSPSPQGNEAQGIGT